MYITVMTRKGSTVAKIMDPFYLLYCGVDKDGYTNWSHLSDDVVYMSLDEAEELAEKLENADA